MALALTRAHRLNRADVVPDFDPDLSSVYRIQAAVSVQLGPVTGYKVASDSLGHWQIAPMHQRWVDGGRIDSRHSRQRGVELEVGWEFLTDPPTPTHPHFEEILKDCIAPCAALEIVETRLADSDAAGPMWRLADNQRNSGWVGAEPLADWSLMNLSEPNVHLQIGSRCVWDGQASVPGVNAFANLVGCMHKVYAQGKELHTGQVIITGSLTGLEWASAGDDIRGWIEGLGSVSVTFEHDPQTSHS